MHLLKEQQYVKLTKANTTELQLFDHRAIAFVVGIKDKHYRSLCVTKTGQYLLSVHKPAWHREQLEKTWQLYYWETHVEIEAAWANTMQLAQVAKLNVGNLHEQLRVASSGKDSFWSPNPSNELGLWFFTPTCQDITINGNQVDFTTTYKGEITHWTGMKENRGPIMISQARVDMLTTFVLRQAAITQRYAAPLFTQVAHDQGVDLPQYPYVPMEPQFPISSEFATEQLIESVAVFFLGDDYKVWKLFAMLLLDLCAKKRKEFLDKL